MILIDTREKVIDHITQYFDAMNVKWERKKLDTCDYSVKLPANPELGIPRDILFDREVGIERKANLDEFANNVVKERERIKKELTFAPKNKVVVIENASYSDMVYGRYTSSYSAKSYYGTIHSWWHEFNVPFVFMEDSKLTGLFIIGFLKYYIRGVLK